MGREALWKVDFHMPGLEGGCGCELFAGTEEGRSYARLGRELKLSLLFKSIEWWVCQRLSNARASKLVSLKLANNSA